MVTAHLGAWAQRCGRPQWRSVAHVANPTPPSMIDGNKTRAIAAKGWVITGVHCVHYTESVVPRTWVPKQMQETDPEVAALVESEDEGK